LLPTNVTTHIHPFFATTQGLSLIIHERLAKEGDEPPNRGMVTLLQAKNVYGDSWNSFSMRDKTRILRGDLSLRQGTPISRKRNSETKSASPASVRSPGTKVTIVLDTGVGPDAPRSILSEFELEATEATGGDDRDKASERRSSVLIVKDSKHDLDADTWALLEMIENPDLQVEVLDVLNMEGRWDFLSQIDDIGFQAQAIANTLALIQGESNTLEPDVNRIWTVVTNAVHAG
jgi:hypothetical protein